MKQLSHKSTQGTREFVTEIGMISLVHVKRSANVAAHTLARLSRSFPDRVFDRRSVPIEVGNIVTSESY